MKRKQFTEEQIIGILKEAEAGAVVTELCGKHGVSSATYYAWKAKFGGLEVVASQRGQQQGADLGRAQRLAGAISVDHELREAVRAQHPALDSLEEIDGRLARDGVEGGDARAGQGIDKPLRQSASPHPSCTGMPAAGRLEAGSAPGK